MKNIRFKIKWLWRVIKTLFNDKEINIMIVDIKKIFGRCFNKLEAEYLEIYLKKKLEEYKKNQPIIIEDKDGKMGALFG